MRLLLSALLLLCACRTRPNPEDPERLAQTIRGHLAARERKLPAFELEGSTTEAGQTARYSFAYRAPNRMRASLSAPVERAFSFDGETLFETVGADRKLYRYRFEVPPEQASLFLNQLFAPFAPEGFRTPLIASTGTRAERVVHPLAATAVRVTQQLGEGTEAPGEVSYLLRWPTLDFLGKKTPAGELTVEAEQCDERLGLCVPRRWRQRFANGQEARTELSRIDLSPKLPVESFHPQLPPGYILEEKAITAR